MMSKMTVVLLKGKTSNLLPIFKGAIACFCKHPTFPYPSSFWERIGPPQKALMEKDRKPTTNIFKTDRSLQKSRKRNDRTKFKSLKA